MKKTLNFGQVMALLKKERAKMKAELKHTLKWHDDNVVPPTAPVPLPTETIRIEATAPVMAPNQSDKTTGANAVEGAVARLKEQARRFR